MDRYRDAVALVGAMTPDERERFMAEALNPALRSNDPADCTCPTDVASLTRLGLEGKMSCPVHGTSPAPRPATLNDDSGLTAAILAAMGEGVLS